MIVGVCAISNVYAQVSDEYYSVEKVKLEGGRIVELSIIAGPPVPPLGVDLTSVALPEPNPEMGVNIIADVPAFNWSFGCSATLGAMIAGYYTGMGIQICIQAQLTEASCLWIIVPGRIGMMELIIDINVH